MEAATVRSSAPGDLTGIDVGDDGKIHCRGRWTLLQLSSLERRLAAIRWPEGSELIWEAGEIEAIDTGGAWLLQRTLDTLQREGRQVFLRGLSPEHAKLLEMVARSGAVIPERVPPPHTGWLERVGRRVWHEGIQARSGLAFLGEIAATISLLLARPHTLRWRALLQGLERDGFNALPITGLLMFLMGVVIAYQGAEQLKVFGANIFIVDLVGISLLREIAPLVTAILVAGRSGSAYAAEIGTMRATEEIDALRTVGIVPMELLVLPRILALVIVLPLLTVFADLIGVLGGMLIAFGQLGIRFEEFVSRFQEAIALRHYLIGIGKAPFFAILIALVGCYQGFQVRGGVENIGRNTTASVVQGIFLVIIMDAFFSILLSWWNL